MNGQSYDSFTVLIVDDDRFTRTILKSVLRQIGVRDVREANDGEEGLSLAGRYKPHAILCDIHMEPVGGLELVSELRHHEDASIRSIPVVFLTSDAQKDTVQSAAKLGAQGYIVKPPSVASVKARLDTILATRN